MIDEFQEVLCGGVFFETVVETVESFGNVDVFGVEVFRVEVGFLRFDVLG